MDTWLHFGKKDAVAFDQGGLRTGGKWGENLGRWQEEERIHLAENERSPPHLWQQAFSGEKCRAQP